MLGGLQLKLAIGGAVLALGVAVYAGGYINGRADGREKALRQAVQAYETRNKVNETVNTLDAFDLCRELGGVPDECAGLRGLDEAAKAK